MKRKRPTNSTRQPSQRETEIQARTLPLRLVLHYEEKEKGWPSRALRSAFWTSDRVPPQHRGDEYPGRPDPRATLSGNPTVVTAFERAYDVWKEEDVKWSRARLRWLKSAAGKEK